MAIQQNGRDLWANALSNANNGVTGTAENKFTATLLESEGTPFVSGALVGQDVYVAGVVGTILSNTNKALTVARWETPGKRGETAAASTPSGTPTYIVGSGAAPAQWMAISPNKTAPTVGGSSTTLSEEIKTAEGGLIRKLATWGHTTGTNTYTLTATYTANAKDSLPVKVAKIGVFNAQNGGRLLYETLLAAEAEPKSSGDALEITDTITGT